MEAIFVLGSNDTRVAEYAAELFHKGFGEYIICSGGNGKNSKFKETEATVFGKILDERGVPKDRIILEHKARNTGENIQNVKRLLKKMDMNLTSFLLVQKPYMERRTYATFKKQWPEAKCIVTSPSITYEDYPLSEAYKHGFINTMVGDLERIIEYPKQGFQIYQEVPDRVIEAMHKLHKLGYTTYKL